MSPSIKMTSASTVLTQSHSTFHRILAVKRDEISFTLSSYNLNENDVPSDSQSNTSDCVKNDQTGKIEEILDENEPVGNVATLSTATTNDVESPGQRSQTNGCNQQVNKVEMTTLKGSQSLNKQKRKDKFEHSTSAVVQIAENFNSGSFQSATTSSPSRKRMRPEEQLLVHDSSSMDNMFVDKLSPVENNLSNVHEISSSNSCGVTPTKAKADSPAFRLRPRRSHRMPGGYSSSGSNSPLYFSPVKRVTNIKTKRSQCTSELLKKTSRILSNMWVSGESIGGPSIGSDFNEIAICKQKPNSIRRDGRGLVDSVTVKVTKHIRPVEKSILQDVDISVFAEFISPLKLSSNTVYKQNYISLIIDEIKPIQIGEFSCGDKVATSFLELICSDTKDRFKIEHVKDVFDDKFNESISQSKWQVYLVDTYARKASDLVTIGRVINIAKFRTAKDNCKQIIVDSPSDYVKDEDKTKITKYQKCSNELNLFVQLYGQTPREGSATDSTWVPLVTFSSEWKAPEDLTELNSSLYVLQPCIPKFESTSRTVKM